MWSSRITLAVLFWSALTCQRYEQPAGLPGGGPRDSGDKSPHSIPPGTDIIQVVSLTRMTKGNSDFDLYLVRNFFDVETCRQLIVEMRSSAASPAVTYGQGSSGEVNERVRKVARILPSEKTIARVTRRLMDHRERVAEHFAVSLRSCEEPQFLCYRTGDFFVAHQDGNTGLVSLGTDASRRVSVSIFLNRQIEAAEDDSYSGGSLVFSDWRLNKRIEFAGEAGTLVAFRSETTHEVIPVTHGERYSIVSWYG